MTVQPSIKVEGAKTEKMNEIIKRMVADSTGDDSLFDTPRFITITLPYSAT